MVRRGRGWKRYRSKANAVWGCVGVMARPGKVHPMTQCSVAFGALYRIFGLVARRLCIRRPVRLAARYTYPRFLRTALALPYLCFPPHNPTPSPPTCC